MVVRCLLQKGEVGDILPIYHTSYVNTLSMVSVMAEIIWRTL